MNIKPCRLCSSTWHLQHKLSSSFGHDDRCVICAIQLYMANCCKIIPGQRDSIPSFKFGREGTGNRYESQYFEWHTEFLSICFGENNMLVTNISILWNTEND